MKVHKTDLVGYIGHQQEEESLKASITPMNDQKCIQDKEHIEFSVQKLGSQHGTVLHFKEAAVLVVSLPKWGGN